MAKKKPLTRSQNMARIRGADTKPELSIRRALWHGGLRYRINFRVLGIRPDLVFLKSKVAIFLDGCFWHGCPLHYAQPKNNSDFWIKKLSINVDRDARQTLVLESAGWQVLRFWEHEVSQDLDGVLRKIILAVHEVEDEALKE